MGIERPDFTEQLTPAPTPPTSSDKANFRVRADTFVQWLKTLGDYLNSVVPKLNQLMDWITEKETTVTNASALTVITANYAGEWNATDDFGGKTVSYNGKFYASKVSPNVGNQPDTDPTSWELIDIAHKHGDPSVYFEVAPPVDPVHHLNWAVPTKGIRNALAMTDYTGTGGGLNAEYLGGSRFDKFKQSPKIQVANSGYVATLFLINDKVYGVNASTGNNYICNLKDAVNSGYKYGALDNMSYIYIPNGNRKIVDVTVIGLSAYALDDNGDLWAWGNNRFGQLGLGHTNHVYTPTLSKQGVKRVFKPKGQIGYAQDYIKVFIELVDGTIQVTGENSHGECGLGHTNTVTTWTDVPVIPKSCEIYSYFGNYAAIFAVTPDKKRLFGWGYGGQGHLGNGNTNGVNSTPVELTMNWNGENWDIDDIVTTGIRAYYSNGTQIQYLHHTYMVLRDPTNDHFKIKGAGNKAYYALGNGSNSGTQNTPIIIFQRADGTKLKQFVALTHITTATVLLDSGELWAWGNNGYGISGNGVAANITTPTLAQTDVQYILNGTDQTHMYGETYALFVRKSDGYYASGYNGNGMCGVKATAGTIATSTKMMLPTTIDFTKVVMMSSTSSNGQYSSPCFVADDQLWWTGRNADHELLVGSNSNIYVPQRAKMSELF